MIYDCEENDKIRRLEIARLKRVANGEEPIDIDFDIECEILTSNLHRWSEAD